MGIVLLIAFLGLVVLGVPISLSMGMSTLLSLQLGDYNLSVLSLMVQRGASNFTLVAIPYFILAGNLMNFGGITKRIFDFADAVVGWMKSGLAQVNVLASMIFAGISGTAAADAAGLGLVEITAMTEKGYDKRIAVGVTLASSLIGPIIPPSITFIIYASLASVSVAKMFMAGLIPGILLGLVLMIQNWRLYNKGIYTMPKPEPFSAKRLWITFRDGFFALMFPVLLLVCLSSGVVTTTETGVLGVAYALFCGLVYKEITWGKLLEALKMTVASAALIMFLIGMGTAVGWLSTSEMLPAAMSKFMLGLSQNKYVVLLLIDLLLLILGMLLDGNTIQLIMVPVLLPIIDALMISRIQFGVLVTLNIMIGMCTPPVGVGLFIMSNVAKMRFEEVVGTMKHFYLPLVIALLLVTFLPWFSTWLPSVLFNY